MSKIFKKYSIKLSAKKANMGLISIIPRGGITPRKKFR
jgi:hypothetical protein